MTALHRQSSFCSLFTDMRPCMGALQMLEEPLQKLSAVSMARDQSAAQMNFWFHQADTPFNQGLEVRIGASIFSSVYRRTATPRFLKLSDQMQQAFKDVAHEMQLHVSFWAATVSYPTDRVLPSHYGSGHVQYEEERATVMLLDGHAYDKLTA